MLWLPRTTFVASTIGLATLLALPSLWANSAEEPPDLTTFLAQQAEEDEAREKREKLRSQQDRTASNWIDSLLAGPTVETPTPLGSKVDKVTLEALQGAMNLAGEASSSFEDFIEFLDVKTQRQQEYFADLWVAHNLATDEEAFYAELERRRHNARAEELETEAEIAMILQNAEQRRVEASKLLEKAREEEFRRQEALDTELAEVRNKNQQRIASLQEEQARGKKLIDDLVSLRETTQALNDRLKSSKAAVSTASEEVQSLVAEQEYLNSDVVNLEAAVEASRYQAGTTRARLDEISADLRDLESAKAALVEQNIHASEQINALQQSAARNKGEILGLLREIVVANRNELSLMEKARQEINFQMRLGQGLDTSEATIRVLVFPNVRLATREDLATYKKTKNPDQVTLSSQTPLHLFSLNSKWDKNDLRFNDLSLVVTGQKLEFDFKAGTVVNENGDRLNIDLNSSVQNLWVVPYGEEAKTQVNSPGMKSYSYRGEFLIRKLSPHGHKGPSQIMGLINYVPIDDYVKAVVPSEMNSKTIDGYPTPIEALMAQAIAARTYAYFQIRKWRPRQRFWDLDPTVRYQSYAGVAKENRHASEAASNTRGQVMVDRRGRAIDAQYHSHSGGRTAAINEVNQAQPLSAQPYLASVDDAPGINTLPVYRRGEHLTHWKRDICLNENHEMVSAIKILAKRANLKPANLSLDKVRMSLKAFENGRVNRIVLEYDQHSTVIEKRESIRLERRNDIKQTRRYSVVGHALNEKCGVVFKIEGFGFGHGLGMSQYGAICYSGGISACANGRAWTAEEILGHYYSFSESGVRIERID